MEGDHFYQANQAESDEITKEMKRQALQMDAEALEQHHTWPEGMTPASERSHCLRDLFENLAYWMKRAGHQFSFTQVGEFDAEFVDYQIGTMTINGNTTSYWLRNETYSNGQMSVEGFGSFYSSDHDEFPELATGGTSGFQDFLNPATGQWEHKTITKPKGEPITKASYPVAYEVLKEMEKQGGYYIFARSDPRILYKHPDTGELLQWPELKKAQDKHFEMISASDVCRLPSFIVQSEMSRLQDGIGSLETSVTNLQEVEQLMKLSKEVEDACDKWGRVEMQLTDGYPLCWVYSGTFAVDPADLLSLFERNGMEFCVSEA